MQSIYNIAEILSQKGVENVILSPGSRCAPLTIAFARHTQIQTRTISDERSAAFIALGLAEASKKPVALLCTSGTAALNYYPAITEAYYRNVPLIVITADRPTEWIDQLDGQTIHQQNVFANHIIASYHLTADHQHTDIEWYINRTVNEAVNIATGIEKGPVHINVALREPLYPQGELQFEKQRIIKPVHAEKYLSDTQWNELKEELKSYNTVMVLVGQHEYNQELITKLNQLQEEIQLVVIGDFISNIHESKYTIRHHDVYLGKIENTHLKADLIITLGLSFISKGLKQFIRKHKPKAHWHISEFNKAADTFQSLTRHIQISDNYFVNNFENLDFTGNVEQIELFENWHFLDLKAKKYLDKVFKNNLFSEFEAINQVLENIPANSKIHLANSMAVRYANILSSTKNPEVWANRGTSGIDGSSSTMIGHSLTDNQLNILITGDMSFVYDRNALWNNYLKNNVKIVILNNHAGGIFRIIDGPKSQPELEEYFETHQAQNAENTAKDFGLKYFKASDRDNLNSQLTDFLNNNTQAAILEIFTESKINADVFDNYRTGFEGK